MPEAGTIAIRLARADDADRIVEITLEVFGPVSISFKTEQMLGRLPNATWADIKGAQVRRGLETNPSGCFVAELDGRVIGYVTTSVDKMSSSGGIGNLAVAANYQQHGAGRKLIEASLDYFRRLGLTRARIETLDCNEAGQHLYPSMGFREVARQVFYVMPL